MKELNYIQIIQYIASSLFSKGSVDDCLWDICENCIRYLNFEDCVIYLYDEESDSLVQKAAFGEKNKKKQIKNPISLHLNQGIVGKVFSKNKAQLINDLSKNKHYVVDDKERQSELAVPIVVDGIVLGVIDSEHSQKNAFSDEDLNILSAIAELTANKIKYLREEEKRFYNEKHFTYLFENASISIWEEDFSKIHEDILKLKEKTPDLDAYLSENRDYVLNFMKRTSIININQATVTLLEAKDKADVLKNVHKTLTEDSFTLFKNELLAIANGDELFEEVASIKTLKGNLKRVLISLHFPSKKENFQRLFVYFIDVSSEYLAEQKLIENEALYKTLYEDAPIAYLSVSAKTKRIKRFNQKALKLFEYPKDEFHGIELAKLIPDKKETKEHLKSILDRFQEGKRVEKELIQYRSNTGRLFWGQLTVTPVFNHDGEVIESRSVIIDVTQEQIAKELLEKQKSFYELVVNNAPLDLAILSPDYKFQMISKQAIKDDILRQWLIGRNDYDYCKYRGLSKEIAKKRERLFMQAVNSRKAVVWEEELTKEDGTFHIIRSLLPVINEKDEVSHVVGYGHDITDRKQAEVELANQEEWLRIILDSIGELVIVTDKSGAIQNLNKAAEKILKREEKNVLSKPIQEILQIRYKNMKNETVDPVSDILNKGKHLAVLDDLILSVENKEYTIHYNINALYNLEEDLIGTVIVLSDLSDKERLASELERVQKLESIGILAGGIAHDFNNILTGIIANLDIALSKADQLDSETREQLEETKEESIKATALSNQLLTFSSGGEPKKKTQYLEDFVKSTVRFSLRGKSVKQSLHIEKNLPPVDFDEGQLNQVIQNIVINALQAMESSPALDIFIGQEEIKDERYLHKGSYICVGFKDNGTGISPEHIEHIFDPYFTTKESGSGLGLASSYSIIKRHGGLLKVESELGKGSSFIIYLPVSQSKVKKIEKKESNIEHLKNKKVLVLDDEPAIRMVLDKILSNLGYKVTLCEKGEEVIDLFKTKTDIDQLILDLTIQDGIGGKETLEIVHKMNPNIKAIASSGYSHDPVISHYEDYGFKAALTKPFTIIDLKAVIKEAFE